jgi:hypothetical protein
VGSAAKNAAKRAEALWVGRHPIHGGISENPLDDRTGMYGEVPTAEEMQLEFGTDVNPFEVGEELESRDERFLGQRRAMGAGIQSRSAMQGAESAYDDLGPSAYASMGPSGYGDIAFDPNRMGESQDYFASVMTDPVDAIAEADYARRQAQAEQMRRSHSEAALAEQEMRGQGGAGDRILSELSGTQAMAGDLYHAGLGANATSQMRRDSAAGSLGDISERMARGDLDASSIRASGMDAYEANRASGLDAFGANAAAGRDAFATNQAGALDDWANNRYEDYYGVQTRNADRGQDVDMQNWTRGNMVNDQNTSAQNDVNYHNKILAPQQEFSSLMGVTAGASGQHQATSNLLADEKARRDARTDAYIDRALNTASNLSKSQGK